MQPPSLDEQIEFQRKFRNIVAASPQSWPPDELKYAQAILESLERLRAELGP